MERTVAFGSTFICVVALTLLGEVLAVGDVIDAFALGLGVGFVAPFVFSRGVAVFAGLDSGGPLLPPEAFAAWCRGDCSFVVPPGDISSDREKLLSELEPE